MQADLSKAVLSGVVFKYADLRGANFTGADVHGADFREASKFSPSQLMRTKGDPLT